MPKISARDAHKKRRSINNLRARIDILKKRFNEEVAELQGICPHQNIIECDYMPMGLDRSMPPMRVCRDCGMSEDGWGYEILRSVPENNPELRLRIPIVSRELVYRERIMVGSKSASPKR